LYLFVPKSKSTTYNDKNQHCFLTVMNTGLSHGYKYSMPDFGILYSHNIWTYHNILLFIVLADNTFSILWYWSVWWSHSPSGQHVGTGVWNFTFSDASERVERQLRRFSGSFHIWSFWLILLYIIILSSKLPLNL
jgi:hypothetical protein